MSKISKSSPKVQNRKIGDAVTFFVLFLLLSAFAVLDMYQNAKIKRLEAQIAASNRVFGSPNDKELARWFRSIVVAAGAREIPPEPKTVIEDIAWQIAISDLRKSIIRTETAGDVEARALVKKLRRELTIAKENNALRNKQLDALHFVWCNGGCSGGVHRWSENNVTEELVLEAERNTARLRTWLENKQSRENRK